MEPFVPKKVEELLPHIDNENKRLQAGCTDIMVGIKVGKLTKKPIIDINEIEEIKKIFEKDDKVYIGANVPISDIMENKIVNMNFPMLIDAIKTIGSIQIRNRATLAGNVQNASPSGDGTLALTAYDCTLILKSKNGEREVSIKDFIKGVGRTDLKNDEFIEYIVLDKKYSSYKGYFEKVGLRNSMIISVTSMAVIYKEKNNVVEDIKIVYGAVATKVLEIIKAEEYLIGKQLNKENLLKAGEIIEDTVTPIDDVRASLKYRKEVCKNLIMRLL